MNKITKNIAPSGFKAFFLSGTLAALSVFFSLKYGSVANADYNILLQLRLPRTLSAFISGSLLATAGSLIQLLLQNPLADPYVLGVSGGAAFVTLILLYCGITGISLLVGAWGGSLLAMMLMLIFARRHHFQTHSLLLTGIAMASGFSAGISFILTTIKNI